MKQVYKEKHTIIEEPAPIAGHAGHGRVAETFTNMQPGQTHTTTTNVTTNLGRESHTHPVVQGGNI